MGMLPYKILDNHFRELQVDSSKCVVEIGSERGEGSTAYFRDWVSVHSIDFHTVDVTDDALRHFINHAGGAGDIKFHITETGHAWCRDVLPTLGKQISVLYLDNFDWIDPVNLQYQWLHDQITAYAARGVVMNNENSQEEHRLQTLYCLPYMAPQSIILIDDSWPDTTSPTGWGGKCGTAIPLMLAAGYAIANTTQGVVCYRGIEFKYL
jgi:hypothetical protein